VIESIVGKCERACDDHSWCVTHNEFWDRSWTVCSAVVDYYTVSLAVVEELLINVSNRLYELSGTTAQEERGISKAHEAVIIAINDTMEEIKNE
jgi:hypothetical protein